MYPATLVAMLAVGIAACVYAEALTNRKALALAGVCLAAIGAGTLIVDYGIQLTVLQPALLSGETEDLSAWSQYNPHGIFIALENIGYATMSLALLLLGLTLWGGTAWTAARPRPIRAAAWILTIAGAATLILMVVLGTVY
ncbi:hypothetical protein J5X84_34015 [Streptosporangiaceae bacterium NEAU-GS5]|nr:hypothetical protein [Streptosporangiaceae bacterium NEAU-GS5]